MQDRTRFVTKPVRGSGAFVTQPRPSGPSTVRWDGLRPADDFFCRTRLTARMPLAMLHVGINLAIILAIALASFAVMATAGKALAQQAAAIDAPVIRATYVRPNDMNTGALLLPSNREGQYVEAPRLASDVDIAVNGPIARVKVTQRFENPADGWVEGI